MYIWEKSPYKEIWVDTGDDEQTLTALINGDYGFLMYLPDDESAGFTSRNPEYSGSDDETMEFYLSNGQLDEYPLSWVIPAEQVEKAVEFFKFFHKMPDFITWHDDSEI